MALDPPAAKIGGSDDEQEALVVAARLPTALALLCHCAPAAPRFRIRTPVITASASCS